MHVTSVRSLLLSTISASHLCPVPLVSIVNEGHLCSVPPLFHYQCMSSLPSLPSSPLSMHVTSAQSSLFSTINAGHLCSVPPLLHYQCRSPLPSSPSSPLSTQVTSSLFPSSRLYFRSLCLLLLAPSFPLVVFPLSPHYVSFIPIL